jgi:predicted acylesterase/phospholipase RssA
MGTGQHVGAAIGTVFLLGACATHRDSPTGEALEQRRLQLTAAIAEYQQVVNDRMVERMNVETRDALARGEARSTFDILILSGGGDYGAFGAGFLEAWGEVDEPAYRRPLFDLVTGVSTGALIAPFAFVGDESTYDRVLRLYQEPKDDWFKLRGLFFFLPGQKSFLTSDGLRRDITHEVDAHVLHQIADASREYRTLWIGTTALDLGILHPWDLTREAEKIDAGRDPQRFYDVLMASAAIPAVFPPVEIDGWMYVDGGTTTNILYDADLRAHDAPVATFERLHPDLPTPRFRFWVIINNQLGGEAKVVQPTWVSITGASVATAIRSSTIGALRQLYLQTELQKRDGLDVEFRFVSIPDDWRAPNPEPFNKETMSELAELGKRMGGDPRSWKTNLAAEPKASDVVPREPLDARQPVPSGG